MKPAKILAPALACLQHPLTWGAILLLLLNDQVLKYSYPSWWTGKLSDFAGLFFFPFVVTLILTVLLRPFSVSERKTGSMAFGLVAVWFTLMKTAPLFNLSTELVWSQLVGYPVQIVQDPTDLLALLALWPAWRLWQSTLTQPETGHKTPALNWLGLIVLGFSALVGLASSCEEDPRINGVVFSEGAFYVSEGYSGGYYARLLAGEEVWEEFIPSVSAAVAERLAASRTLPITACLTQQANICYRVEGKEQVLASEDGGETWRVEWEIPVGRRQFMARFPQGCGGYLDMGPYDLAVGETDAGHYVVAAMGTEGVLMRQADGSWLQQAVLDIQPTPFFTTSLTEIIFALSRELPLLMGASFVFALVTFMVFWKKSALLIVPLLLALVLPVVAISILYWQIDLLVIPTFVSYLAFMISAFVLWLVRGNRLPNSSQVKLVGKVWLGVGFGIFIAGALPLILWTMGIISHYDLARVLSLIFTPLSIWFGGSHMRQVFTLTQLDDK